MKLEYPPLETGSSSQSISFHTTIFVARITPIPDKLV